MSSSLQPQQLPEESPPINSLTDRPLTYAPAPPNTRARMVVRAWATLILLLTSSVLAAAIWLKPDPRGHGTHRQLGMAPCGMLIMTGFPCPTCGMTTAFAHTVRGQVLRALWVQPGGFVLCVATMGMAAVSILALVRGRWPRFSLKSIPPHRLFIALLVILLGGWAFRLVAGLASGEFPVHSVAA